MKDWGQGSAAERAACEKARGKAGSGTAREPEVWDGRRGPCAAGNGVRDEVVQDEADLGLYLEVGVERLEGW